MYVLRHTLKEISLVIIIVNLVYYISIFQIDNVYAPSLSKVIDEGIGDDPRYLAFNGDEKIYVANHGSDTVSVINSTTDTVIKIIPVGKDPYHSVCHQIEKKFIKIISSSNIQSPFVIYILSKIILKSI